MRVLDYEGKNYQFTVPKLQCYIIPEECKYEVKANEISVSLRKAKNEDNWWSLYRTKAVGETESD